MCVCTYILITPVLQVFCSFLVPSQVGIIRDGSQPRLREEGKFETAWREAGRCQRCFQWRQIEENEESMNNELYSVILYAVLFECSGFHVTCWSKYQGVTLGWIILFGEGCLVAKFGKFFGKLLINMSCVFIWMYRHIKIKQSWYNHGFFRENLYRMSIATAGKDLCGETPVEGTGEPRSRHGLGPRFSPLLEIAQTTPGGLRNV